MAQAPAHNPDTHSWVGGSSAHPFFMVGGNIASFLGIDMAQYWMDLFIWEHFLNDHPLKLLLEFGTGHGGMSLFLALQCAQRGIKFMTFDNIRPQKADSPVAKMVDLQGSFRHVDVFSDDVLNTVTGALDQYGHPACMFFDDGDKPREWRRFAPHAAIGDYLVVHDWETEAKPGDLPGSVEMILKSEPRNAYKTAWFRKTG